MSTYTATTVPTQFVEANGILFAYRRWGKRSGLPLVFNLHAPRRPQFVTGIELFVDGGTA